nr:DUF4158 domain-containing protein [Paraburkholderia sp. LEh10]
MSTVHETAYPVLPAEVSEDELRKVYTPSAAEIRFICGQFRQAPTRVLILAQLKLLQRLGYMPPVCDLPLAIIDHDDALRKAFDWLRQFHSSRREYLLPGNADLAQLPLDWIPEKWEKSVFSLGRARRSHATTAPAVNHGTSFRIFAKRIQSDGLKTPLIFWSKRLNVDRSKLALGFAVPVMRSRSRAALAAGNKGDRQDAADESVAQLMRARRSSLCSADDADSAAAYSRSRRWRDQRPMTAMVRLLRRASRSFGRFTEVTCLPN